MESLTYHFLFNLSLMIALFYICYISTEKLRMVNSRIPSILFYSTALILSYVFSYRLTDDFIIDMRFVPFLIGSLYHPLIPLLGFLAIIFRGFHGIEEGFYIHALTFVLVSIFLWKVRPYFLKLRPLLKVAATFSATFLYGIVTLLILQEWIPPGYKFDIWFAITLIQSLSALILTYLIELINENDENERQMVRRERQKAIEEMGAAISHDIRNPLTTAIGFTELLASESLDYDNRRHFTSILRTEIERAEQIIQNYLNFTKPATLTFSQVNVNEEMIKVVQMLQPLANYHTVQIDTDFKSKGALIVDRQKFIESMAALIRHSVIIAEQGGSLFLASSNSRYKVTIRIEIRNLLGHERNQPENTFGDQSAVISAMQTLKAMKGIIEHKSSPFSHALLITFKDK